MANSMWSGHQKWHHHLFIISKSLFDAFGGPGTFWTGSKAKVCSIWEMPHDLTAWLCADVIQRKCYTWWDECQKSICAHIFPPSTTDSDTSRSREPSRTYLLLIHFWGIIEQWALRISSSLCVLKLQEAILHKISWPMKKEYRKTML